MSTPKPLRLW